MKKRLLYRQLQATGLGLLMALPMLSPLFHAIRISSHHFEMWSHEIKGELQTLEIDASSIRWKKENKELLINGRYFDVKKITYSKDKAILTGFFDEKEDLLEAAFNENQTRKDHPVHSFRHLMLWLSPWYPPGLPALQEPIFWVTETSQPFFRLKRFQSFNDGPMTPPPRFLSLIEFLS